MARTSAKAKKLKQTVNNKTDKVEETASESKQEEGKPVGYPDADDSTDKENDDVNFEVEKIIHTRVFRGKRQYLIRWKGYGEDSDTWENESAVQSCSEALETFKNENSVLVDKSKGDSDNDGDDEETEDTQNGETKGKMKSTKASKKFTTKTQKLKKAKKDTKESDEESEVETTEEMDVDIGEKEKKNIKKAVTPSKKNKGREDKEKEEPSRKKYKINESEGESEVETTEEMDVDVGEKEKKDTKKAITGSKKNKGRKDKEKKEPSRKKSKNNESDDESVTDGKNYEVEKILEVHTRKDKTREFLIRWKGYKPSEDTWEPEAHLDCQDMIDKFMEKVDKAKNIPARELRESRAPANRFISHIRSGRGVNLRNTGIRPCYQE